jgi:hypothetical protein
MLRNSSNNDESIISILKDGTGEVIHQGMLKEPLTGSVEEHLLKNIDNDIEEEGGKGVALPEAASTLDPSARDPIKENRRLASMVEHLYPSSPKLWKALGHEDTVEGIPANRVKGFSEIKFENRGRSVALVAGLHKVSGVEEVLGNGAPGDKTSLVLVDQRGDEVLEPKGQAF